MSDKAPSPRNATVRDELRRCLRLGWASALQLSSSVGLPEKAIPDHLEHLRKSAPAAGERFEVEPARCTDCDFEFDARQKLTRPSKCPKCRGQRIEAPRFRLSSK